MPDVRVFPISGAAHIGLRDMLDQLWRRLAREKAAEGAAAR